MQESFRFNSTMVNLGTGFQESLTRPDGEMSICSWTPQDHGGYTNCRLQPQAAQAHYVWVWASEVIWSEYTRIISVLSDA